MALLDDDGSGDLGVHEMIDLFVSSPARPSPRAPPPRRLLATLACTPAELRRLKRREPRGAQDGIDNDALLINDCNDNQMPHHWLGDGFCDDGSDVQDGGGDCALIA